MFVFDTSAYINGQHNHFFSSMLPSVWTLVGEAIEDGRILVPREVFRELTNFDDDLAAWIAVRERFVVDPSKLVQQRAGAIESQFPKPGIRNGADPFILAEAETRGFTVVTYEGQDFSGVPTKKWAQKMPGVCHRFDIACCTLPEALRRLGLSL